MELTKKQDELIHLIEHYSTEDGIHTTDFPSLVFIRQSKTSEILHRVYTPSFCFVLQGSKENFLARERFIYGANDYLVTSVHVPVSGQIIEASAHAPYLAVKLDFTPSQIFEVLRDANVQVDSTSDAKRAMFVSQMDESLFDAVTRLVQLLHTPKDIPVLGPLIKKEILYRILQGTQADILKQMVLKGSSAYEVNRAIEFIMDKYNQTIRIDELAELSNMSVSTLHRHFKAVTGMSPIQFQKQIRLQKARYFLVSEGLNATEAAFRVGYESATQFSREYSRMFGSPPKEDIK